MRKEQILVAFSAGGSGALGNIWRITAKKTDFYLDPLLTVEAFHLSVHGPEDAHPRGHRFHLKMNRKAADSLEARGDFVAYNIPRRGYPFNGQEIAPGIFRVARIRWRWDLQRPRFQHAAAFGPVPDTSDIKHAARLAPDLLPNEAADLDLVVSYNEPHWPDESNSLRDNARLPAVRNDADMWLTATSYRRSQTAYPAPEGLELPVAKAGEQPARIMGSAPGPDKPGDMYWFVESMTSREFIEASRSNAAA
jgi:hypothetical protein